MTSRAQQWSPFFKGVLVSLPLGLVILATVYAVTPPAYRPFGLLQSTPAYPVRISLTYVEQATEQRDLAARRAQALAQEPVDAVADASTSAPGDALAELQTRPAPVAVASAVPTLTAPRTAAPATALLGPLPPVSQPSPAPFTRLADDSAGDELPFYPYGFDLRGQPADSKPVDLRIGVSDGGKSLGKVAIRITADASLFISRADVARVLPAKAARLAGLQGKYVRMSTLRAAGIDLQYNAVKDRLDVVH